MAPPAVPPVSPEQPDYSRSFRKRRVAFTVIARPATSCPTAIVVLAATSGPAMPWAAASFTITAALTAKGSFMIH